MWCKFHFTNGQEVYVQSENVVSVTEDRRPKHGKTIISFAGFEDNWIEVSEPISEVMRQMLNNNEGGV